MSVSQEVMETVSRHIEELRDLCLDRVISEQDHDRIGHIMCTHLGDVLELTAPGYKTLLSIFKESREVWCKEEQKKADRAHMKRMLAHLQKKGAGNGFAA